LAYAFANPLPEPSFAASEDTGSEVQEPSEEEPSAAVPGPGGQSSTSGGYHFMQESELDNAGLVDSQEWVDVPQSQTEVRAGTTNVETPRGEGIVADQTDTVAQQSEVMTNGYLFSQVHLLIVVLAAIIIGFWKL
jgi:hypothetical protein